MPANTTPIFPLTPATNWGTITTANTAKDGTGTVTTIFTAGANGSRIDQIKIRPLGTNVQTVVRFFLNNGSANSSAANNSLIHEYTVLATTVTETAAQVDIDLLIDKGDSLIVPIPFLPAGYKINITVGTTIAAGLSVVCHGGNY